MSLRITSAISEGPISFQPCWPKGGLVLNQVGEWMEISGKT